MKKESVKQPVEKKRQKNQTKKTGVSKRQKRKKRPTTVDPHNRKRKSAVKQLKKQPKNADRRKRRKKKSSKYSLRNKKWRWARDAMLSIVLGILLFLMVSSWFMKVMSVSGYGMVPTLRAEDIVLVRKRQPIKRFDLIAFSMGNKVQIRRVIGLPGEKITYEQDVLYVDDAPIDEKFIIAEINESQAYGREYTEDFTVSDLISSKTILEGYYLVLGDNRPYATDSRHYGLVAEKDIIGKATLRLFPLNEVTGLSQFSKN